MKSLCRFYQSTIGKKIVVALTGLGLVGFVIAHLLGNLQVFIGPQAMDRYAALLKANPALLWSARIGLMGIAVLHVVNVIQLTARNKASRPQAYEVKVPIQSTLASRTMVWGGLTLLLYVVYHILHFTTGSVHRDLFVEGEVYANLVRSFQKPFISVIYIVAQIALFFHLSHGFQSAFRSLGVNNEVYIRMLNKIGMGIALFISLGFISIPLAVLFGFVS